MYSFGFSHCVVSAVGAEVSKGNVASVIKMKGFTYDLTLK